MNFVNYHTHSHFCDGREEPEEYIRHAILLGFKGLGFSAHAPLPFENAWSLKEERLADYLHEINRLKKKYSDSIRIFLGLEVDYVPAMSKPFDNIKENCSLDYIIGAVHLVPGPDREGLWFIDGKPENFDRGLKELFHEDIKTAVAAYFCQLQEMIRTQPFDVLAHFDKIKMNNRGLYFQTTEDWYLQHIHETMEVIAAKGCIMEVNTRGIYKQRCLETYPSLEILKEYRHLNIPLTISTDAHHPSEIALLIPETREWLRNAGYPEIMVLGADGWKAEELKF